MKNNRRDFLKLAGMAGFGLTGAGLLPQAITNPDTNPETRGMDPDTMDTIRNSSTSGRQLSIIGQYGPWANSLLEKKLPEFSLRRREWSNLDSWRESGRKRMADRMAIPEIKGIPQVTVHEQYTYDGLHVEELSWQLPYGRPTKAILLKPQNATGALPGILAFFDHGLQKYFGAQKITKTADRQHPVIETHQRDYYEGAAWANEIARRGYVVLVADVFTFGSRRVKLRDVPEHIRRGADYGDPDNPTDEEINAYNQWTASHEHILAKSLFSAGTTWPGVFFGEDRKALNVLCTRDDVDENRVGCGGLSGGGIRTVYMAGMDPRIKCTVCSGFMTTWKDLILYTSFTHTWMTYVPLLPNDLEFTEIIGLRAPLPTLVQNCEEDPLFTLPEMKRADEILKEVYHIAGGEDRYKNSLHPGGHKFDRPMQSEAFDWYDRWLKS